LKLFHNLKLSVFSKEREDEFEVRAGLLGLLPFDSNTEKLRIEKTHATGFNERKILILELILT
jgi:RNA binding exosome subunit